MRSFLRLALLVAAAGCGGSPALSTRPQGYATRMESADDHARRAAAHRKAAGSFDLVVNPDNYQCGDRNMSDQLTSGGQRMLPTVPCWDPVDEAAERHRAAAAREDHLARQQRRAATDLVETELAACRGITGDELSHSPFAHPRAIAEVIPHRRGRALRGVRIVFRPIPGLTEAWMEQAVACHRARYERPGEPATYLAGDPTLVPGAVTTVATHRGHLEVLVVTPNDVAANVALGRARDLVAPRTAGR
jgi:hypothetical protein